MKLNDILHEDLGTLAQLGVGPLINILKQPYYSSRRGGSEVGEIGKKFATREIGSTSEIVDIGVIKQGLKSIRKAFKQYDSEHHQLAQGFAIYIGGNPVMFVLTNSYDLAGSSRPNEIAYDFRKYSDIIDRLFQNKYNKPDYTTIQTKPPRFGGAPRKFAGEIFSTSFLSDLFDVIEKISTEVNQPVTAKLVLRDMAAQAKRLKRALTQDEILKGAVDLKTRLAIYKNKKRPTVNNIEEFIDMSLRKPGKKVQFAGYTYHLVAKSHDTIKPIDLLSGKTFDTYYSAIDPDATYNSVQITYRYDNQSNQLIPIKARWSNRELRQEQTAILNPEGYFKKELNIQKLEKKDIISALIKEFENSSSNAWSLKKVAKHIADLRKHGYDYPEFNVLEKAIQDELASKTQ